MNEYNIYPKQYQHANIPIEKNKCFVIMPFKQEFDYVYGIIKDGLNNAGYTCNRVDEISGSVPIVAKILNEILSARYIIADLSGCNPNVFYELGVSHSFKDAHNIIILKQKNSSVPFDIMHLTYVEYDNNNAKLLVSNILKSIEDVKYISDFQEILNIKGIIPYISEDNGYFVDFLKQKLGKNLIQITKLLQENQQFNTQLDVESIIKNYECILSETIKSGDNKRIENCLKLYYEILKSSADLDCSIISVQQFIDNSFFAINNINDSRIIIWQTDLCISMAKADKMLHIVLPWIINYFSRTKTATIDLNRYKLFHISTFSSYIGGFMNENDRTTLEQAIYEEMELTPEMIRSIRTLCGVCLCSFVESKAFKIAIVPSADRSMDTCTVCQTRRGHDYVVMNR